ncbi:MAG TPA: ATP-grasp domain-containing protein [Bacteroidota bacterium]|nr:ATP-grasp domain-containing protein [Bacteroidota bacterium]
MRKKLHVSVIFNEPTVLTSEGRKFISESGTIQEGKAVETARLNGLVDMSEVGVVEEREQIQTALGELGYQTSIFNMSNNVEKLLEFLKAEKPDLIFNLVESLGDQSIHEMHVAGIYEILEIPYTGSPTVTLGTCLNKARTKEILSFHGIPTAKFIVCKQLNEIDPDDFALSFPLIVKPAKEDASVGIDNNSIVDSLTALKKRVRYIFQEYDQPAIVEEYIEGRELNVAIIGNGKPIVLPISEIDFSGLPQGYPKIVTYDAKWLNGSVEFEGTKGVCPADLPAAVEARVKELALQAYQVMGCRDYARVDFRLAKNNKPYVLEVNPNPDISDDAGFIRSTTTYGYTFNETIGKIVEYALKRNP